VFKVLIQGKKIEKHVPKFSFKDKNGIFRGEKKWGEGREKPS
jgi:hypothetical protein